MISDLIILTQDVIDKTFEISDKAEEHIHIHEASTLKWGCIKNFYKDPVAVKEFLQKFPVVPQSATVSPGSQQHFPMPLMANLTKVYAYLYGILSKYKFPIIERSKFDNDDESFSTWQTYCNTHWKHMDISATSMIPHSDPFSYAFNIWLTDDNPAGTEFYYNLSDGRPIYYGRARNPSASTSVKSVVWDADKIDTFFVARGLHKYLGREPENNSRTFYPSLFFHKPEWDSRNYKEDLVRYSQVYSYRVFPPQQFPMVWDHYKNSEEYKLQ